MARRQKPIQNRYYGLELQDLLQLIHHFSIKSLFVNWKKAKGYRLKAVREDWLLEDSASTLVAVKLNPSLSFLR